MKRSRRSIEEEDVDKNDDNVDNDAASSSLLKKTKERKKQHQQDVKPTVLTKKANKTSIVNEAQVQQQQQQQQHSTSIDVSNNKRNNKNKDIEKVRRSGMKAGIIHPPNMVSSNDNVGQSVTTNQTDEINNSAQFFSNDSVQQHVLFQEQLELVVSILPGGLHDKESQIHAALRSFLFRYTNDGNLNGIMLAYHNVSLLNNGHGMIHHELPCIHYTIHCTALIFRPQSGNVISGIITGSFYSHIALIVFRFFNASISAQQLRSAGYEYDPIAEHWYHVENTTTRSHNNQAANNILHNNTMIHFVLDKVHEANGIISMEGLKPSLSLESSSC
jgi:DNA-directed RNA polymerase subunit E'/Rpb7